MGKKTYFTIQLSGGVPSVKKVKGTAIKILDTPCFWYEEKGFYYIVEKETGLAFSAGHFIFSEAKSDAILNATKHNMEATIKRAKKKYPNIIFPLNK